MIATVIRLLVALLVLTFATGCGGEEKGQTTMGRASYEALEEATVEWAGAVGAINVYLRCPDVDPENFGTCSEQTATALDRALDATAEATDERDQVSGECGDVLSEEKSNRSKLRGAMVSSILIFQSGIGTDSQEAIDQEQVAMREAMRRYSDTLRSLSVDCRPT